MITFVAVIISRPPWTRMIVCRIRMVQRTKCEYWMLLPDSITAQCQVWIFKIKVNNDNIWIICGRQQKLRIISVTDLNCVLDFRNQNISYQIHISILSCRIHIHATHLIIDFALFDVRAVFQRKYKHKTRMTEYL